MSDEAVIVNHEPLADGMKISVRIRLQYCLRDNEVFSLPPAVSRDGNAAS